MGKAQREKGKRGERMFAKLIREHGLDDKAHRGVQYQGGPDSPDITTSLPIHFEVKFVERLGVRDAYAQAETERKAGDYPVVAWKKSNAPWLAVLSMEDLFDILRRSDVVQSNT